MKNIKHIKLNIQSKFAYRFALCIAYLCLTFGIVCHATAQTQEIDWLKARILELDAQRTKLQQDLSSVNNNIQTLERDLGFIRRQLLIAELNEQNTNYATEYLASDLEGFKSDHERAKADLQEKEQVLGNCRQNKARLTNEIVALSVEISNLTIQISILEAELSPDNIQSLTFSDEQTMIFELMVATYLSDQKIADQNYKFGELDSVSTDISWITGDIYWLKYSIESLENDIRICEQRLQAANDAILHAREEVARLQAEEATLDGKVQSAKQLASTLEFDINFIQIQIDDLYELLNALEGGGN
jgi:chromosome segregation ATPase